jgi:hypothetical protein
VICYRPGHRQLLGIGAAARKVADAGVADGRRVDGEQDVDLAAEFLGDADGNGDPGPGRIGGDGVLEVGRPPIVIVPPVISSTPAMERSAVDFPHPEGPTSTMNSPSAMCRLRPSTPLTPPR